MSNKLIKAPSPLDTPVRCALCGRTLYGPTGDMDSEKGLRFKAALHRHVAAAHPERAQAIVHMNDIFVSFVAYTLFVGDENFQGMIEELRATLANLIQPAPPQEPPAEPPAPAESNPENNPPAA